MTLFSVKPSKFQRSILKRSAFSLATLLAVSAPIGLYAQSNQDVEQIEITFVLDTTGSMADLIDGAKQKIWSIANTVVDIHPTADIRMALIGYRDYEDEYVMKTFPLNSDLQGLYGDLTRFQAAGGGDEPEAVNEALGEAVHKIEWGGEDVHKIIFLVGDAPPHMDYQDAQYPEITKDAKDAGIIVNTVLAGTSVETARIWSEIAKLGGGRFAEIPQDGGEIVYIPSPFDDEILTVQKKLDQTIVSYGSQEIQANLASDISQKSEAPAAVQVENSKFYSSREGKNEVITSAGDLVADILNEKIELDKLAEDEMPEELKGKSQEEIATFVEEKAVERGMLEEEMDALLAQRDSFVENEKSKNASANKDTSFDRVVQEMLEAQIK